MNNARASRPYTYRSSFDIYAALSINQYLSSRARLPVYTRALDVASSKSPEHRRESMKDEVRSKKTGLRCEGGLLRHHGQGINDTMTRLDHIHTVRFDDWQSFQPRR